MKINHLTNSFCVKDIILITIMLIVIISNSSDLVEDGLYQEDSWIKVLTIGLSLWGTIVLFRLIKQRKKEIESLQQTVENTKNDLEITHSKLRSIGKEYSKYLHKQFDIWNMTPSERDIGLALLKGLSFKEMAEMRDTKTKTVRHQASTIYKKANVAGRHEFSAWFFEDMLV